MAEFDLVIRAGTVVDGTGARPRTADVAVRGDRVAAVGRFAGRGTREVSADGAIVAPGFVDIHTHYDGQATWESRLQPSSWHGVTTVVMGNCGVGFAPVTPANQNRLIELMEGVEDIPGIALHEGLAWDWESFPQYLDALERRDHDVDLAAQIPHAPLRVHAMGERAAAHTEATPAEIETMAQLAAEAVEAGALGFSTSRSLNHRSIDGQPIPSYDAGAVELLAIAAAIGKTDAGVLQVVSDFHALEDPAAEFELFRRMARTSRRPLSMALVQFPMAPRRHLEILDMIDNAQADGLQIRAQVAIRPVAMMLGLPNALHPFVTNPRWSDLADLTSTQQAARMADRAVKREILAEQDRDKDPSGRGGKLIHKYEMMYELTDPPDYEPAPSASIARRAAAAGQPAAELAYDLIAEGRTLYVTVANYAEGNLDAVHTMLTHPHTVPGLSDGGAHVGYICDGSFPTTLLQHWVRDRDGDRLDLADAVSQQTRGTARAVGLLDRGVLAPGYRADLNVIDLDRLRLHRPEIRHDLPAGGRRFVQRADGYAHTFVAGQETYRAGEPTDALPGRLVRGSQAAPPIYAGS